MWPFTNRRPGVDEAHLELVAQIHAVIGRVKVLEDDLAALESKYERLRGRFYATRPTENPDPPPVKPKDQILREYFAARANRTR